MRIRTYEPRRYFDVLTRGEDIDINMYDDNELMDGYKFEADYFRERIANVLVVERTEDFAVIVHPLTKELELHNIESGKVDAEDIEVGDAHTAQDIWEMAEQMPESFDQVEDISNQTGVDKYFIAEVLYGN